MDSSADAFDSEVSLALDSAGDTFGFRCFTLRLVPLKKLLIQMFSFALDSAEEAFDSDVSLALDSAEEAFDSED